MDNVVEIVLPSGEFAKFRTITGRDYRLAQDEVARGREIAFTYLVLTATIDDKPITYEQLDAMDLRDINALVGQLVKLVMGPKR